MKKQSVLRKGLLLTLFFLCGTMAAFSQTLGDVNNDGSITIVDALMIAQAYVGMNPSGYNAARADVSGDGAVTIVDALMIAQYYVGIITSFPAKPSTGPSATPRPSTNPSATHNRVANPFTGAKWYIDEVWSAKANQGAGKVIAKQPTAMWIDRIGAITDGIGIRGHLDNALSQGATMIMFVIYDLPNRDCSAAASNGELLIAEGGMSRYQNEYIDPIVAIFGDPAYRALRIVCIVEPDSLPNLVTNNDSSHPLCQEADGRDGYVDGVQYALEKLGTLPNTYCYVDFAHSGWLGWDDNFQESTQLIGNAVKGYKLEGFITNTANYTPLEEPYLSDPNKQVGGQPIRSSDFYEWNPYFGELSYAKALYSKLSGMGLSGIGMLIDTSRNGWGGSGRPTSASTSSDLNTYVNNSRIDRRNHRGNWCNQKGGIGERPKASPASNIDAYVWVKPPGESDGVSTPNFTPDPNDPAKKFDTNCGPNEKSTYNSNYGTGAIDAPHAGRWNEEHMEILVKNAYPSL